MDQASLNGKAGGAVFILGIGLTGGAGGFWVGYVTTRTFLTFLFDLFGKPDLGDVTPAADPANLQFDAQQKPVASTNPLVVAADTKLRKVAIDELSDPKLLAAWGAAQARASNLGNAIHALQRAAGAAPNDSGIRSLLDKVEQANKGPAG